jgi:hypothetical protein
MRPMIYAAVLCLTISGLTAETAAAKPAKKPAINVSPGLQFSLEMSETVRVMNLQPVGHKSRQVKYGDTCQANSLATLEVVALVGKPGKQRALVRVVHVSQKSSYYGCPNQAIFFLPVKTIRTAVRAYCREQQRIAREKALVEQLLKQAQQRKRPPAQPQCR